MGFPSQYGDCSMVVTVQGSNPNSGKGFFSSPKHPDGVWSLPSYYSMGASVQFWDKSGRGVKLTIHHHLVPRLRVSGAELVLPLYAFMAGTRKTTSLINLLAPELYF